MSGNTTARALSAIIAELPDVLLSKDEVLATHRLREDIGLDSLSMIDLILAIEEEFSTILDPTILDFEAGFETVESLALMVDEAKEPAS